MEPNPTKIPTDMPIGPPDPLPFPSKDVKGKICFVHMQDANVYICSSYYIFTPFCMYHILDHMFCGIGIDNASAKCEVACPNANECPEGESELFHSVPFFR